jgi:hypothetical protein
MIDAYGKKYLKLFFLFPDYITHQDSWMVIQMHGLFHRRLICVVLIILNLSL